MRRIDTANVGAWTDFARRSFDKLGYELREGLTTIAMALFMAFADIEDGMTIDQVTDKLGEMHLAA